MIKKSVCIVLDTETIGDFGQPMVHDVGYTVIDKEFNKLVSRRYLVKEFHDNAYGLLASSNFYVSKEHFYISAKQNKEVESLPFNDIMAIMFNDIKQYKVTCVCAYNLAFDDRALKATYKHFNKGNNEEFVKKFDRLTKLCIYNLACDTVLNTDDYREYALKHNLLSEKGNYSSSAESCYKYITNNADYVEEHTALKDVFDEVEILAYIITTEKGYVNYGLFYNCWQKIQ